jgi:chromate transport protein ChrA
MVRYAVIALIIALAIKLVDKSNIVQLKYIVVIIASIALFTFGKIHPAFIIVGSALYGGILNWLTST